MWISPNKSSFFGIWLSALLIELHRVDESSPKLLSYCWVVVQWSWSLLLDLQYLSSLLFENPLAFKFIPLISQGWLQFSSQLILWNQAFPVSLGLLVELHQYLVSYSELSLFRPLDALAMSITWFFFYFWRKSEFVGRWRYSFSFAQRWTAKNGHLPKQSIKMGRW